MTNDLLSSWDIALLHILARVRGLRPETAFKYVQLKSAGSVEAIRKRMDRLCNRGFLAKSPLPRGGQIFRLSHKGVRFTSAPAAFANAPSNPIGAEMLSVGAFGWKPDEYLFLTAGERDSLLRDFAHDSEAKVTGRLLLRSKLPTTSTPNGAETHLNQWLAELRPASELAKRVEIIVQNLRRFAVFDDFISAGVFGITIAVPSHNVKAALDGRNFPVTTEIVVVEELQHLFS